MTRVNAKKMSPAERVLAMEEIWESMRLQEDEPKSPNWHANIVEERKATFESGKARFVTLEQLKARLVG
jgi:hypothetical protein